MKRALPCPHWLGKQAQKPSALNELNERLRRIDGVQPPFSSFHSRTLLVATFFEIYYQVLIWVFNLSNSPHSGIIEPLQTLEPP